MHEIVRPNEFVGRNQDRKEFKVVGNRDIRIPGALSYALATGAAKYSRDIVRPGMLHAKFLRSPYAHARIKKMDTRKAEALPGVKAVVTCEDEEIKAMPLISVMYKVPFSPFTPHFSSLTILSNEAEREGEEVGLCLAAESEELCDEALKLVEVEWEILPFALDPREALAPGAPILHPELTPGTNCSFQSGWEDGNVEAGFREADHIIEYDRSYHGMNNHKPNPYAVVAWWEQDPLGTEGKTLYMEGNQHNAVLRQIRDIFKLPEDKLRWLTVYDGGQYCDFNPRRLSILAPLLAKRTGRPVRIAFNRRNTFDVGAGDHVYTHVKIGFKNDGVVTAAYGEDVSNGGTLNLQEKGQILEMSFNPPPIMAFRTTQCANIKSVGKGAYTNTTPFTASPSAMPWEPTVAFHKIADMLGMDPTEVALKNCHTPEPSLKLCIEKGKAAIGWDKKWHAAGTKRLPNGKMHGMAFTYRETARHSGTSYTCLINIRADGKVYLPYKGPLRGVFCEDACALVVAEELGARPEDVIVRYDPEAPGTTLGGGLDGGSSATWVAKEAAIDAKKALLRNAANTLKAKPEDLDTADSQVYFKAKPEMRFNFGLFAQDVNFGWSRDISVAYSQRPPGSIFFSQRYSNIPMWRMLETMNATFCEVEVDTDTGEVEITHWAAAHDVGKAIRPSSIEGQIEAQFIFSTGLFKTEELIWDKKTGVLLNGNDLEYKIPTIMDVAPIAPIIVETRLGNGCYGATGVYHTILDQALWGCAVQNAIGKWICEVPITPDKVLKALGKI